MSDCTPATVAVGLDVHARSIRLAAVSGTGELVDERTLVYDHEAVERVVVAVAGGSLLL